MKDQGKRRFFSTKELQYLEEHYPNTSNEKLAQRLGRSIHSIEGKAFLMGLKKTHEYLSNVTKRTKNGKKTRFKKGHVPFNKGTKGVMKANVTSFKKGNVPHTTKYDGCITLRRDTSKVGDTRTYYFFRVSKSKWVPLHYKLWTDQFGPVPHGHVLRFIDGNTMNCVLDNIELVSMRENMLRNQPHQYGPEISSTIRIINKIKRHIHERRKPIRPSHDNVRRDGTPHVRQRSRV